MVLGAQGILAKALCVEFRSKNHIVIGVSRSQPKTGSGFSKVVTCNYGIEEIRSLINTFKPSLIVNTIGEINIQKCQNDIEHAYKANYYPGANLCSAVNKINYKPFLVQISTDNLYSKSGFSAEKNITCLNSYGFSKYMGEVPFRKNDGLILRTNYLARTKSGTTYFDWVYQTCFNSPGNLQLYRNIHFNPTSVKNIADNILFAFKYNLTGIFNLGVEGSWTKASFHLTIAKKLGKSLNYTLVNCPQNKVPRPLDMRMNVAKAKEYGFSIFQPEILLKEIIMGNRYEI